MILIISLVKIAVGKSNFLDLLEIVMECHGFNEHDFTDVHKPIRIDFELSLWWIKL